MLPKGSILFWKSTITFLQTLHEQDIINQWVNVLNLIVYNSHFWSTCTCIKFFSLRASTERWHNSYLVLSTIMFLFDVSTFDLINIVMKLYFGHCTCSNKANYHKWLFNLQKYLGVISISHVHGNGFGSEGTCFQLTSCIKRTLVRVLRVSAKYKFNCNKYFAMFSSLRPTLQDLGLPVARFE